MQSADIPISISRWLSWQSNLLLSCYKWQSPKQDDHWHVRHCGFSAVGFCHDAVSKSAVRQRSIFGYHLILWYQLPFDIGTSDIVIMMVMVYCCDCYVLTSHFTRPTVSSVGRTMLKSQSSKPHAQANLFAILQGEHRALSRRIVSFRPFAEKWFRSEMRQNPFEAYLLFTNDFIIHCFMQRKVILWI